jgi:hypothetical protein
VHPSPRIHAQDKGVEEWKTRKVESQKLPEHGVPVVSCVKSFVLLPAGLTFTVRANFPVTA